MSNETTSSAAEPENLPHSDHQPDTPLTERQFYKLDEVADLLNVSKRTVAELVRTRELKSHRIRGNRRVSRQHLAEYIEQAATDERPTLGDLHQETVSRPRGKRETTHA